MAKLKKRKDGRYQKSVSFGYKPNGSRDRRYVYGYTEAELEDNYAKLRSSRNDGTYADDGGMTVGEWAETWYDTYKSGKSLNTRRMYRLTIDAYIKANIGHLRLRDVKTHICQGVINALKSKGNYRTAQICRLTLNQMFDLAMEDGMIPRNPARKLVIENKPKPKSRCLTSGELGALASAPLTDREKAFLYIGVYAGLRKGEILALEKRDVNLADGRLSVTKAVEYNRNQAQLKNIPKTEKSVRSVPIIPLLKEVLGVYINTVEKHLFVDCKGHLLSDTLYRSMWRTIERKVAAAQGDDGKQPHITSKMLRHTYATMLYYAGVNLKQAQAWMGHADTTMLLEVYTHLDANKESEESQKFIAYIAMGVSGLSKPAD